MSEKTFCSRCAFFERLEFAIFGECSAPDGPYGKLDPKAFRPRETCGGYGGGCKCFMATEDKKI